MPLGMGVGDRPGHIVLDGDPPPPQRGTAVPYFSAHVYCGQTAGWIKMPLGKEVGLGPGDIVLDGEFLETQLPVPTERGTAASHFSANIYFGQTVAHLSYC